MRSEEEVRAKVAALREAEPQLAQQGLHTSRAIVLAEIEALEWVIGHRESL